MANWREYWMKAWMSPMVIWPEATRRLPTTAIITKFRLPENIITGCTELAVNCDQKLAS